MPDEKVLETDKKGRRLEPVNHKSKTLRVREYMDIKHFIELSRVNPVDLSSEMMMQASTFIEVSTLHAKAMRQVEDFKMASEAIAAFTYRRLRDAAVSKGEKPTEAQLTAMVNTNEKVRNVRRCLNAAKQHEAAAKGVVEAFRHKRDMLIQMGLHQREEMKGEVSIAKRAIQEDNRQAQQDRILARQAGRLKQDSEGA